MKPEQNNRLWYFNAWYYKQNTENIKEYPMKHVDSFQNPKLY